ncbi:hypothetical protein B296_00054634 [Ensete ventricosum]|uniref:Uncharacterized protein n=1 Tax=Ensete ventricosum TaxID=4639 RepID=A0A426XZA6_ENSVE|nr:hypothetical protein B296_00054634 [Ensete ventricosum]
MVVFPALSRPSTRIRASRLPKRDENKRVKRMPMDAQRIDQIETVGILRRESRSERRNPTPATKGEGLKGSEEGGREDPKVADEVVVVLLFERIFILEGERRVVVSTRLMGVHPASILLYNFVSSIAFAGYHEFIRRAWQLLVRSCTIPTILHQLPLGTIEGTVDVMSRLPEVPMRSLGERDQSTWLSTWSSDPSWLG